MRESHLTLVFQVVITIIRITGLILQGCIIALCITSHTIIKRVIDQCISGITLVIAVHDTIFGVIAIEGVNSTTTQMSLADSPGTLPHKR